jgi:hypothetical protein
MEIPIFLEDKKSWREQLQITKTLEIIRSIPTGNVNSEL